MTQLAELRRFCEQHELGWSARTAERFATYVDLLEQFNAKMNLVGPLSRTQIERQLLIDSVACAVVAPPAGRAVDVGTGAGLPGIPLAILYDEVDFTLVEPRKKRTNFMRIATHRLGLQHTTIVAERIEDTEFDPFDWLVSKAFRAPPVWLDVALPLAADGAKVVCLHAASATAELQTHAATLGIEEVAHIADVATMLEAAVPDGRAISVYGVGA